MRGPKYLRMACLGLALLGLIGTGCSTATGGGNAKGSSNTNDNGNGNDNGIGNGNGNGNSNTNGSSNANANANANDNGNGNDNGAPDDGGSTATSAMLFVVNNNAPLTSYDGSAQLDGDIAPTNLLNIGVSTALLQPRSLVVTRSDRLLISRQNGGIVGYENARTVDGAAPGFVIEGPSTLLDSPVALAYDEVRDFLYVGNVGASDGILVFENVSGDTFVGDVMPVRRFGPVDRVPFNTDVTSLVMSIDAMDLDARGNLYVSDTSGSSTSRILFFTSPETDDGLGVVTRSFTSIWGGIEDFVVDDNDVLFVVDSTPNICVFRDVTQLDGMVQPDAVVSIGISGADLQGIVVDSNGTAYVADTENDAIYVIAGLVNVATGTVLPDRTLSGAATELSAPRQMFLLER
ncbi:MAG: hypothetical protein ACE5E5_12460 [Phycisphaerae bacterium]